ncbi:hypothetical protein K3495_g12359 [Podosphaera aphanis]|nr:hypothetical protein K3495_g12359 [Podosphaera aphanis]
MLEHETSTLPIEIYLKQRRVQYAGLSRNLPAQLAIKAACRKIKRSENESDDARVLIRQEDMALWLRICEGVDTQRQQNEACKRAAFQEWAHSWGRQKQNQRAGYQAAADPIIWRAANLNLDKKTGRPKMNYRGAPSKIHRNLSRAESSIATQIRSEHIGLNSYLFRRKVPNVETPSCQCGYQSQNVQHMVMVCPRWAKGRGELPRRSNTRSFKAMIDNPEDIARITKWIQMEGWLDQFLLTSEVEAIMKERAKLRGQ